MRANAVPRSPGRIADWARPLALAALMVGAASTAWASNGFHSECDEVRARARIAAADIGHIDVSSLDIPGPVAPDLDALRPRDDSSPAEDRQLVPHLYLGPRVATIVRDVFGEDLKGLTVPANADEDIRVAPLAEVPADDQDDSDDDALLLDERPYSPLSIHREMYRTDI